MNGIGWRIRGGKTTRFLPKGGRGHMRKFFVTTFVLAATLCLATSSMALEKRAAKFDDSRSDDWNAAASCLIRYYNTCTGWLWVWSGWADGDRVGQVVNSCCPPGQSAALLQTATLVYSGGPPGYGFTGTIAIHNTDANDCPTGAAIGSQPFLAGPSGTFVINAWGGLPVPNEFAIVNTVADALGFSNPMAFGTEHPAAGPTGPQACGSCYPLNRVNRSFYYGTAATPICPGSPLNDGVCDAQFLWEGLASCIVSVEETSWGSIKGLYR